MKIRIALATFLIASAVARADDTVSQAQQALKDQGFYYGQVSGKNDADTSAAIKRFQIRNGLQVTGDLNSETMRALMSSNSSPPPTATVSPSATPYVATQPSREPEREDENSADSFQPPPPDRSADGRIRGGERVYPSNPTLAPPEAGGLFAGTPYESAPPPVQSDIILSAQSILARRDFYRGEIDGVFGPNTEFSLRAYQARAGLPVTGRLDLQTLAALNLLPGPNRQFFGPRHGVPPRFVPPPVRGEWIH